MRLAYLRGGEGVKEIPAKTKKKKKKKPKRERNRTCKSLSAFVHRRLDKKKVSSRREGQRETF